MLLLWYPKCTTCQGAKKWLDNKQLTFDTRDIKLENPTAAELKEWHLKSGYPLKKFFNTSGIKYKELELKDKLAAMPEEEQYKILASDGMLVKRPLIIDDSKILVGFKEKEWEEVYGK